MACYSCEHLVKEDRKKKLVGIWDIIIGDKEKNQFPTWFKHNKEIL